MSKQDITDNIKIDFLESYSRNDILNELQRISKVVNGRPITKKDIIRYGRVSYPTICRKFGGLIKAITAAGLSQNTFYHHNISNEELLNSLIDLWSQTLNKEGRRPEKNDLKRYGIPISPDTYYRRFGGWRKALIAAYNFIGKGESPNSDKTQSVINKDVTSNRSDISIRKRFLVFKRDEFTCIMCGRSGRGVKLEVDHKIPVSKGGGDELDNLQTLCFECNRGKRDDFEISEL